MKGTRAAQAGHIIYLDAPSLYLSGGITAYTQQVNRIYRLLTPQ